MPQAIQRSYLSPELDKNVRIKLLVGSQEIKQADSQWQNNAADQNAARAKLQLVTSQKNRARKCQTSRPIEDIVERNIATLGVNRRQQGSYLKTFEQRGWKTEDMNRVCSFLKSH